jgi:hypothetical protein
MKNLIVLFSLVLCSAFAGDTYQIKDVKMTNQKVTISYETIADKSAMCYMSATSLKMTKPEIDDYRIEVLKVGTIEIESSVAFNSICLMAFGPHRGSLSLNVGEQLPSVAKGETYQVIINGDLQEKLVQIK